MIETEIETTEVKPVGQTSQMSETEIERLVEECCKTEISYTSAEEIRQIQEEEYRKSLASPV